MTRAGALRAPLAVAALVLVAACGSPSTTSSGQPSDCGTCSAQVAALRTRVAAVDGVASVRAVTFAGHVDLTRQATLTIGVNLATGDATEVSSRLARIAWESAVPAEVVDVRLFGPAADGFVSTRYAFTRDAASFEHRWGKRGTR